MSDYPPKRSFDAFHTQLQQMNEQRRQNQQPSTSTTSASFSSFFSLEDIPFHSTMDRKVGRPPPLPSSQQRQYKQQQHRSISRSDTSSDPTSSSRNDYYSQRTTRPAMSVGFDSRDPPRGAQAIQPPPQQQQQNKAHDGWPEPPASRRSSRPPHPQHHQHNHHNQQQQQQQQQDQPLDQSSPTRVKMIQPDRFQQWQSEATQLWINGIDINMEERPGNEKKKKAGWLTKEEFASYSTTSHSSNNTNMQRTPSPFSSPPVLPQQQQQPQSSAPAPTTPALGQRSMSPASRSAFSSPTTTPPPSQPLPASSSSSSSSSAAAAATTVLINKLRANFHSPAGRLVFLDAIESGLIPYKVLISSLPSFLQLSLDTRCVDKLLALVVLAPSGDQPQLISQLIQSTSPNLLLHRYLPFYVCLPRDVILVADFLQALFTHCPTATTTTAAWSDVLKQLQERYIDHLKPLYPTSTSAPIDKRLEHLHRLQSNVHDDEWGGWNVDDQVKQQAKKDDAPKRYLKEQLTYHQQQLMAMGTRAIQLSTLTTTTTCTSPSPANANWLVFKHVQWYRRAIVQSPAIPAPAHVYLTSASVHPIDRSLIGCLAMLVDTSSSASSSSSSSSSAPLFGTFIGYTVQSEQDNRYLVAIYHSTTPAAAAPPPSSQQYDLVLTTLPATCMLALIDWLRTATASDINLSLAESVPLWPLTITQQQQHQHQQQQSHHPSVADYLDKLSLDVSTIMTPTYQGCKANISENSWPVLQAKHRRLPPHQRPPPLYTLSDSQVRCLQYAMAHRVAFVAGPSGSGKSHVASKCLTLVSQVLQRHWLRRPILVLCDSVAALTSLVTKAGVMQETILFGEAEMATAAGTTTATDTTITTTTMEDRPPPPPLHIMSLENLPRGSAVWRQYRYHSRELELWVTRLQVLQAHRHAVVDQQQAKYVADLMPPSYRQALHKGHEGMGCGEVWLDMQDPVSSSSVDAASTQEKTMHDLMEALLKQQEMTPVMAPTDLAQQQEWMRDHPVTMMSLLEDCEWPFVVMEGSGSSSSSSNSNGSKVRGDMARYALMKVWSKVAPQDLWHIAVEARRELYAQVVAVYDTELAKAIAMIQARQTKTLAALHQLRVAHWKQVCTFRRVVAMTTSFAMVHAASLIRAIDPMVVLMDINQPPVPPSGGQQQQQQKSVSGAMLAALALGPETQHVMVFGNGPHPGDSNNGGGGMRLEEQWRMTPLVWQLWQVAIAANHHGGASANDMVSPPPQDPPVSMATLPKSSTTGVKYPTYCVALEPPAEEEEEMVNDVVIPWLAQLICYIYQQDIPHQKLLVLMTCDRSVAPLKAWLKQQQQQQQQQRSVFLAGLLENVTVASVTTYQGDPYGAREADTVVLGVMDSYGIGGGSSGVIATSAQLSMALSRAKSALYVVGARTTLAKHDMWLRVLNYMEKQGRCMNGIPLICLNHPETETIVKHIDDFAKVENGGCDVLCRTMMDCGHTCQEKCHRRSHQTMPCQQKCERPRPLGCTHSCSKLCHECTSGCSPCLALVTLSLPCGHTMNVACHRQDEPHVCPEIVTVDLPCGHTMTGHCGDALLCMSPCPTLLECGHPCQKKCGEAHEHPRSACTFECPKTLICGHNCANGCAKPDEHTERCLKTCARQCFHGYKCGRPCWKMCVQCISPCPHECPHSHCTKRCSEPCDRAPCNEPCPKLLSCSHPCRGLCGEPCTPCAVCRPDVQCPITLRTLAEFAQDERFYTLPECGCSFTLDSLDQYFSSRVKSGEHTAIKQWICPSCQVPILTAGRYANEIKAEFDLIDTIKAQQEKLTDEERLHIVNAMNEEPNIHANDIVGGRWFVCKNRHPYFIGDCGGATEISTCPECNEPIGGRQHQVVNTNRFYGEFDGSSQPAWPGQPGE